MDNATLIDITVENFFATKFIITCQQASQAWQFEAKETQQAIFCLSPTEFHVIIS